MKTNFYETIAAAGVITERQIITIKSRANRGADVWEIFNNGNLRITQEQTKKGLSWLLNQWKTPRGIERKNNPFGYREQEIINNFDRFALVDFYNVGRYFPFFVPVYRVISRSGSSFEYYYNAGRISIIG
jgi:hypothetical protein